MKQTISLIVLLSIMGCGDKKSSAPIQPVTKLEQKLAKLDEKIAHWEKKKKSGEANAYTIGYNRIENGELYYVDMDFKDGKFVCRAKTTQYGQEIERGDEVNTHDWENTLARTIEEIHAECRKSITANPDANLSYSWGSDLVWCQGNFGIEDTLLGVISFGHEPPACRDK